MNGKAAYTIVPPSPRAGGVEDEWGLFDPTQAGLTAACRATPSREASSGSEGAPEPGQCDELPETIFPDDPPAPVRTGPTDELAAMRKAHSARRGEGPARLVPPAPAQDERVYELSEQDLSAPRHNRADRGAVYTLEFPTRCPQCCSEIGVVRVSRLLRSQVSFTSTLPRKGYVIVCPECDGILSAELSGLI
jgi:hypothetical protein